MDLPFIVAKARAGVGTTLKTGAGGGLCVPTARQTHNNMIEAEQLHAAAKWYLSNGLSVFPLAPNDKRPLVSWQTYQSELADAENVHYWDAGNLALATGVLSRVAVIDCESRKDAEWFTGKHCSTPVVVQTRRGFHLWFRYPVGCEIGNAAKVKDESGQPRYDVRGEGGYVVCPPSSVEGWTYQFVFGRMFESVEKLPEFRVEWMPKRVNGFSDKRYTDGVAYISKIRAVSGAGGHNETWRAVNVLKDSGMSETEALAAMVEWNATNADPVWSVHELLHKVTDCYGSK